MFYITEVKIKIISNIEIFYLYTLNQILSTNIYSLKQLFYHNENLNNQNLHQID